MRSVFENIRFTHSRFTLHKKRQNNDARFERCYLTKRNIKGTLKKKRGRKKKERKEGKEKRKPDVISIDFYSIFLRYFASLIQRIAFDKDSVVCEFAGKVGQK